jgi:hypothetical protein
MVDRPGTHRWKSPRAATTRDRAIGAVAHSHGEIAARVKRITSYSQTMVTRLQGYAYGLLTSAFMAQVTTVGRGPLRPATPFGGRQDGLTFNAPSLVSSQPQKEAR